MKEKERNLHWITYLGIVLVAAVARFALIGITPWDWDESIYTNIAQHVAQLGYPALTPEIGKTIVPFLYHPPFHSYILSGWYSLLGNNSIFVGRLLSSLFGVLAVVLCMKLVSEITKNRTIAVLTGLFIALDGWFTYSSTLVKLDVAMLALGMVGLLFYAKALRGNSLRLALFAGLTIGAAVIYKHTGIVFVITIVIHWLLFERKQHKLHFLMLGIILAVSTVYFGTMYGVWGQEYLSQSFGQIKRIWGLREAVGLNFGITETINALRSRYWIFAGSILAMIGGGLIVLIRTLQILFKRRKGIPTLLLAWAIATGMFILFIALRNPHYLVMFIVPLYGVIAYELTTLIAAVGRVRVRNVALVAIIGIVVLSFGTLSYRATVISDTNALKEVQAYITQNIPKDKSILADQTVCAMVSNPFYQLGTHRSSEALQKANPDYLVWYTTTTYSFPKSELLTGLMQKSSIVFETKGWKEEIKVYKIE